MKIYLNKNPSLPTSRLETERCLLVPFSLDGRVDIHELATEFCRANKDLYVAPVLPTYEEELEYVRNAEEKWKRGEEFENFILDHETQRLIGCGGLRLLESWEANIGIWIREDEQGKGYASEVYTVLLSWAREYTGCSYLVHAVHPENIGSQKLAEKFAGKLQDTRDGRGFLVYHIVLK